MPPNHDHCDPDEVEHKSSTENLAEKRNSSDLDARSYRLSSVDAVRGVAIVLMALDHVRDFFMVGAAPDPMADPNISYGLFATRWITHLCAPAFVLLAGTSAGLMSARKMKSEMAAFFFTRGAWLIVVEWFVISNAWTFSPYGIDGEVVVIAGVIWAIGASMVLLSIAQTMGRNACLAIGLLIVSGHNSLDPVWPVTDLMERNWPLWTALHSEMSFPAGPFVFYMQYPLLPWVGVMLAGYGMAFVFELPVDSRNRVLFRLGIFLTSLFFVLRFADFYGDPNRWTFQEAGIVRTLFDFLNTTKYPPSLLFLLMTIGPALVACSVADRITGSVKDILVIFGRAPFAFYVAHLFLIHLLSILLGIVQGFDPRLFFTHFGLYPPEYGTGLLGVYMTWVLVVVALFPMCRYVADLKSRRRDWWLSYL